MLTLNEYQQEAAKTALGLATTEPWYCALGLCGEAGEVAEKVKKLLRDGKMDIQLLTYELGDVLWYLAMCAKFFNITLEEVGRQNLLKLEQRKAKNAIHGEGDVR